MCLCCLVCNVKCTVCGVLYVMGCVWCVVCNGLCVVCCVYCDAYVLWCMWQDLYSVWCCVCSGMCVLQCVWCVICEVLYVHYIHYAKTLNNILNQTIKIKHLVSWRPLFIPMRSHPFQGEGDPCGPKGRGDHDESPFPRRGGGPWWVTLSKEGWGTVMSHPFQRGVGGGTISHPKGVCPKGGGGSTNHNQGEGVGGR